MPVSLTVAGTDFSGEDMLNIKMIQTE